MTLLHCRFRDIRGQVARISVLEATNVPFLTLYFDAPRDIASKRGEDKYNTIQYKKFVYALSNS